MSEKYYYTKNIDPEVLNEAINIRTSLRLEFIGCRVNIKSDGSIDDDNVELEFSRALVSSEQDEISNLVNEIGPSYDLAIRKNIEKNTMVWAMETGKTILSQFSANNVYRQKSNDQIDALVENYSHLINSLITGSLTKAYREFNQMVPDENISQEEIDEFIKRMQIALGI